MKSDHMHEDGCTLCSTRVRRHNGEPGSRLVQCREASGPPSTCHGGKGDRVGSAWEGSGSGETGVGCGPYTSRWGGHRDAG
jgi:hypothetical protein